jgi:O-antigen ligase/thioredoxin-like negative regulator of GroEL
MSYQKKQTRQQHFSSLPLLYFYAIFVFIAMSVIYLPDALDAVQPPRLLALSMFLLVFGIFLWRSDLLNKTPISLWNNPLIWCIAGYLLITVVSMVVTINIKESYFDVFKSFTFLILVLFTIAIAFNTPDWFGKITKFIIVSAFVAICIGILQYVFYVVGTNNEYLPDGLPVIYQVKGLMAHKNQYAINLMLMLPMIAYGIFSFTKKWRVVSIIAAFMIICMILLIQTRSVWTAILLSSAVLVCFLSFWYKLFNLNVKQRNWLTFTYFSLFIALFCLVIYVPAKDPHSRFAYLKSIANPDAGNNIYRLKIWNVTTRMIADNPLTGVGAGNWKLHSANYYKGLGLGKKQLNWIEPHNDFLWVFAEKGVFGIILFLSIFIITLYYLLKVIKTSNDYQSRLLALLLIGGLLSYLVTSLFDFPLERINQQIYLAFFLASAIILYQKSKQVVSKPLNRKLVFVILVLLILPILYSSAIIRSDQWLTRARYSLSKLSWKNLLAEIKQSETWARDLDPESVPLAWYEGLAWSGLNERENALAAFQKAIVAHPTKISVLNNLGIAYYKVDDYENAIDCLKKAIAIQPDYKESNEALASIYVKLKEYQQSLKVLNNIKQEERIPVVLENLQALKKIVFKQLIDSAIILQKAGEEKQAWIKLESASKVYQSPDKMLQMLEVDYFTRLSQKTFLEILRLIPINERSKKFQGKIGELKSELRVNLNKQGDSFYNSGDFESAANFYGESLHVSPETIETLKKLRMTIEKTGQFKRFLQILEEIPSKRRNPEIEEAIRITKKKIES